MASFAPIRGTRAEINSTAIIDGQFLIETDQGDTSRIYLDIGTGVGGTRNIIGGGGSNTILGMTDVSTPTGHPKERDILKYTQVGSSHKFVVGQYLDDWLRDINGVIQEPYILPDGQTATFTDLNPLYGYDVYISVAANASPPTIEDFVINSNNEATVTVSKVTQEQAGGAGGHQCVIRLRELR